MARLPFEVLKPDWMLKNSNLSQVAQKVADARRQGGKQRGVLEYVRRSDERPGDKEDAAFSATC